MSFFPENDNPLGIRSSMGAAIKLPPPTPLANAYNHAAIPTLNGYNWSSLPGTSPYFFNTAPPTLTARPPPYLSSPHDIYNIHKSQIPNTASPSSLPQNSDFNIQNFMNPIQNSEILKYTSTNNSSMHHPAIPGSTLSISSHNQNTVGVASPSSSSSSHNTSNNNNNNNSRSGSHGKNYHHAPPPPQQHHHHRQAEPLRALPPELPQEPPPPYWYHTKNNFMTNPVDLSSSQAYAAAPPHYNISNGSMINQPPTVITPTMNNTAAPMKLPSVPKPTRIAPPLHSFQPLNSPKQSPLHVKRTEMKTEIMQTKRRRQQLKKKYLSLMNNYKAYLHKQYVTEETLRQFGAPSNTIANVDKFIIEESNLTFSDLYIQMTSPVYKHVLSHTPGFLPVASNRNQPLEIIDDDA